MAWHALLCSAQVWEILIGDAVVFEITVTEQKDPESSPHLALGFTVYALSTQASNYSELLLIPEASI